MKIQFICKHCHIWILLLLLTPFFLRAQSIEKQALKLTGKFSGEWTSYKRNVEGEIETANTWKDTLIASDLQMKKDMAFVNVHVEYTYDNPQFPPASIDYKEGFYIKGDEVKGFFFSSGGEIRDLIQLDDHTFAYSQKMHQNEFVSLRFLTGIEGYHTILKVFSVEKNKEIQRITRVTTIQYYNEKEEIVTEQFVSLKGYRKRIE